MATKKSIDNMTVKEYLAELKKACIKVTLAPTKPKKKVTKRAQDIFALANTVKGCLAGENKRALMDLVELLAGEPLPKDPKAEGIVPGMIVIPKSNPNSHEYPLFVPALYKAKSSSSYSAKKMDGRSGNQFDFSRMTYDLANRIEINSFFAIVETPLTEKQDRFVNFVRDTRHIVEGQK